MYNWLALLTGYAMMPISFHILLLMVSNGTYICLAVMAIAVLCPKDQIRIQFAFSGFYVNMATFAVNLSIS